MKNISKIFLIFFVFLSIASCKDNGCISADDFGGTYIIVDSNPKAVYGNYPLQSTDWMETGLRASGGPFRIAITGSWVTWGMVSTSDTSLAELQSCFATKNFNPGSSSNNYGLCAKRVPIDTSSTPHSVKTGSARITDLNQQNCICYKGENPVGVPNATRSDITTPSASCSTSKTFASAAADPPTSSSCSCQKISDIGGKPATEDYCVFHYSLSDKSKLFDAVTGDPSDIPNDEQGNICKFEKGMGLYMGLFGRSGARQPHRAYHLFTQTEECPVTRDSSGRCLQDSGEVDSSGNAIMVDRTRYIYTTAGMPIYDDKSGNNCTDTDSSDDEYHRMREVVKLKIYDPYYQDNYGKYKVEFLSGVYSNDNVQVMEAIVNLIEEVLLGKVNTETGVREGGILLFLYNSILGNSDFILIVKLCLIFYIVAFGITTLLGLVEINRKEIFMRIFQIGIVLFFTTEDGWQMYDQFVVSFFKAGMDEVINKFLIYANTFFTEGETTTNPMRAAQLRAADPDSMGAKFAYIDYIIRMLFSEAITKKIWSLFFYSIFGILYIGVTYMLIFYFLQSMGIVVFVYCVTVTKMVIALALGPIFFVFMLFKQTNEYFKKWITFLSARAMEMVILFLLVFVFLGLIDRRFNELLYYSACIIEWDLWLFKFKWLVARDVFTTDINGLPTTNSRDLVDWFLMFSKLGLTIYATKQVIMQVPQLAGKLISIGGAANETGSGSSYASSAFQIGAGMSNQIFNTARKHATNAAMKGAGMAFRGGREMLKNTAPFRALGYGLDSVGRQRIRNHIIDTNIKKAAEDADRKGLTGADRDKHIRNFVMNEAYKKDKGSGSQGGIRGWARKNRNSAALLNINTDTISKRLDQRLLEQPMKKAMQAKAKELKKLPPGEIPLGKDMKAALEKEALRWAQENTSQDKHSIFEAMDKIKGQKRIAGSNGGWRPRRVNYLDELSKVHYEKASAGSRFGGDDESKQRYLSHLKSRQFEKASKGSEYMSRTKEAIGWTKKRDDRLGSKFADASKESKAFIRRAHDKEKWNNIFYKGVNVADLDKFSFTRGRRDNELGDLEYNAVRNSLFGNEFNNEKNRLRERFDDSSSMERQRAEYYGENYTRQLDKKRDDALKEIDEKRKFFMNSLGNKMQGDTKKHYDALEGEKARADFEKSLLAARDEINKKYREDMASSKMGSLNKENIADGLMNARLENGVKIGDQEYKDLSLFEINSMLEGIGKKDDQASSEQALNEMAEKRQELEDKAKEQERQDFESKKIQDEKRGAEDLLKREAEESQKKLQDELKNAQAKEQADAAALQAQLDNLQASENQINNMISGYRASTASLNGDINAMARLRGELELMICDPNINSGQYSDITMMLQSIQNEEIRAKLEADYQALVLEKKDEEGFDTKELIKSFEARVDDQAQKAQDIINEQREDIHDKMNDVGDTIQTVQDLSNLDNISDNYKEMVDELKMSMNEFDQANANYNKDYEDTIKQDVIVKDLEVEFGKSFADALSVGGEDALIKGGNVAIGGEEKIEQIDGVALSNAQMAYTQHKYKVKVNKSKMAHLEYQESNLERSLQDAQKSGDKKEAANIQSQISSIKSEKAALKSENAQEMSRMNDAEFAVSQLERGNM